jgi:potassium-transporting ATPase KdpC subunit
MGIKMLKVFVTSIKVLLIFTFITFFVYHLVITGIAQIFFKDKANGSLIIKDKKVIGSALIGQKFNSDKYFWSRPSAIDYNPMPSGGSNLGPTSKILKEQVVQRNNEFKEKNFLSGNTLVPAEMLFASASGVDPDISPGAAYLQVERICWARNFNNYQKKKLINLMEEKTELPVFGFLGEERINVLELNIELDKIND